MACHGCTIIYPHYPLPTNLSSLYLFCCDHLSILLTNSNSWKEGERASCWDSAESSLLFLAFLLDLSDHLTLDVELYILYENNSGTIGRSPFCPLLGIDYSRLDIFLLHPQNNMHLPKMFSIPFDTTLC